MTSIESHQVAIRHGDRLEAPPVASSAGVLVNLYVSANYVIVDVGLPRCRAETIRVSITADKVLVESSRHLAELSVGGGRTYLLHELPQGRIARLIQLPDVALDHGRAEAHFANGMLVVSIPMASPD